MTALNIRPGATAAWNDLGALLTDLADDGLQVPCTLTPAPFVSDEVEDRRTAIAWCSTCPALTACARFAEDNREPFGVWGGRDMAPRSTVTQAGR